MKRKQWCKTLPVAAIALACCGDANGTFDPAAGYGPACCALVVHGAQCGWNYSDMKSWKPLFDLGVSGDEPVCAMAWDEYVATSDSTDCRDTSAGDTALACTQNGRLANGMLEYLDTPNQYAIPKDFPQLAGEIGAAIDFRLGTADSARMIKIGGGFAPHAGFPGARGYFLTVETPPWEDQLTFTVRALEAGTYTGSTSDDSADAYLIRSIGHLATTNGSITVEVDGVGHLAAWGEIQGSLCDDSMCLDFTGTFSATRPGVWVR